MRKLVLTCALLLLACDKRAEPAKPSAPAESTTQAAEAPHPAVDPNAPLPVGHPPVDKAAEPPAAAPTGPALAGGLTWEAPAPLVRRAPKSNMRVAEYGLEGAPEAELTVFYFGADQGGSVEANMTRWVGQFSQKDGSETKAKRSERKVKDLEVSLVEATGVYSGGMMAPGAGGAKQEDAMLLGAIAKGPEGAVFFKLVGPRDKLESSRAAFDGLIDSIRPAK